jgi:hypothetical protein
MRQGAAWPTERLSRRLVVLWVVARWQIPHRRRAVIVAERSRWRLQIHGSASQRAVGWPWWSGMSVRCQPVEVALSEYSVASTRPVSGERPVSAHVISTIRCPLSGVDVRCPGVGVRAFRVRVRGVCTGDFVERVGAAAATRPGGAGSGRPAVSPNGSTICVSQRGFWSGLSGVAADA